MLINIFQSKRNYNIIFEFYDTTCEKKSLLSLFDNWNIGTESSQDPNRLGETIMGQYGCLYGQLTFKGIISPTLPQLNRQ